MRALFSLRRGLAKFKSLEPPAGVAEKQTNSPCWRNAGISLLVFCAMMLAAAQVDDQQSRLHQLRIKEDGADIARSLAQAIENELNKRLLLVQSLVAFKASRDTFTHEDFQKFAGAIEAGDDKILTLQLAPNGVITYVTKPEQNAATIGHDLLGDPRRAELAYRSIESGKAIMVGPLNLVQGGRGLIARKPIYSDASDLENSFWGFATVVLNFDVVTDILASADQNGQFQIALRGRHGEGETGEIFWGEASVFDGAPTVTSINLPEGSWRLATLPKGGWPTSWPFAVPFKIATLIASGTISALLFFILNKPIQLRRAVRNATAELMNSEKKLLTAQRIAKIGSWEMTSSDHITMSEDMLRIMGIEPDDFDGKLLSACATIHPKDHDGVLNALIASATQSSDIQCAFDVIRPDGSSATIKLVGEQACASQWSNVICCGTIQDITEQIRNEEKLRTAQKMEVVGRLTGGIAHDFNNLLTVIQGNAELLELSSNSEKELVREIQVATQRGAALTHRLLAYARKQPLSPRTTNLAVLARGMEKLLSRSLGENIEIEINAHADIWNARVDANQIEDAILNLAINSRDAMPNGGCITIGIRNVTLLDHDEEDAPPIPSQYVSLSISDNGTGMSDDTRARAFEPFFSTKGVGKGSGLGLSMVSGLIEQSGGKISISSQIGEGTTGEIHLPRDVSVEIPEDVKHTPEECPKGQGEMILLVEDNIQVRATISRTLSELGYNVSETGTVKSALSFLRSGQNIDLVLLDIVLPGGASGLDLAPEIRQKYPDIGVVLVSGYPSELNGPQQPLPTSEKLLNKPFATLDLALALRAELERTPEVPKRILKLVHS